MANLFVGAPLAASLSILSACGAGPAPTPARTTAAPVVAPVSLPPPAAPPRVDLHALDFAHERCAASTHVLAQWLLTHGPSFVSDDPRYAYTAPATCELASPIAGAGEGAAFHDLDGDGEDEALTTVTFRRTSVSRDGYQQDVEASWLVLFHGEATDVSAWLVVAPGIDLEGPSEQPEAVDAVRFAGSHVVMTVRSGCYDCGCNTAELELDCATGPCRFLSQRITDAVEDCDSP